MNYVTEHPVVSCSDYDGDTLSLSLFLGDDILRQPLDYRVIGVDCPEHKGRTLAASKHVVALVNAWLVSGGPLQAMQFDAIRDKWGRPMADLYHVDSAADLLSRFLLDKKLAHVYNGGTKTEFTDAELAAILAV